MANFVGLAVAIPTGIIATRVLGPERYGLANLVLVWAFYADLFRPGLMAAAGREIPTLLSAGRQAEAERSQSAAVTGEAAYGLVAVAVMAVASLWQDNPTVARGLQLAAAAFALTHCYQLLLGLLWAHQRFGPISRITLHSRLASSLFTLTTVWWLGPFSLVLAPGIAALVGLLLIAALTPIRGLRLEWRGSEMRRLFSVGVLMMLFSYFIQGFKVLDRTAIAAWMRPEDLGYFGFALSLVFIAVIAIGDFQGVMQPMVWEALGKDHNVRNLAAPVTRVATMVFAVVCAGASIGQAAFGAFVHVVVPNFERSVPLFEVLVLLLPLYTATNFPTVLLISSTVNRQGNNALIWGAGLAAKALLLVLVVRVVHSGLAGVAVAGVVAQALVVVGLYAGVHKLLFDRGPEAAIFYCWLAALLLVAVALLLAFSTPWFAYSDGRVFTALARRFGLAVATWSLVGFLVGRRWGKATGPRWPFSSPVQLVQPAVGPG